MGRRCQCRGECSLSPRHLDLWGDCYEPEGERFLVNAIGFTGWMCEKCRDAIYTKRLPRKKPGEPTLEDPLF